MNNNTCWDGDDTGEKTQAEPVSENHVWESNKQEVPAVDPPLLHTRGASIDLPPPPPPPEVIAEPARRPPSLPRILIRVWQLVAGIGAFGFQVGATPYSGEQMPFSKPDLLYLGYVISWLSIVWSSFNIFVYLTRRFGNGHKIKRFVSTLLDVSLTALFGVCVFYQIATYKCKPGLHNGWCDFFNTGIFFLMSLFLTYVIHALWDLFGAMTCLRR